jgi:hypothetical protein
VSSANNTGMDLLFIALGKSFIYVRKNRGPIMEPCGTPCLTFAQLEKMELFVFLLYV